MRDLILLEDRQLFASCSTKQDYIRTLLSGTDYVLCLESAAEWHGLSNPTFGSSVRVCTKQYCDATHLQYAEVYGVLCTSVNQTINDLLRSEDADEQDIIEVLYELSQTGRIGQISISQLLMTKVTSL